MLNAPWTSSRSFKLGDVFVDGARRNPDLPVRLTRPMGLSPALGIAITLRDCARLVEASAARLRDAGVLPGDRVAVVKTPSPDVTILQQAVARIGAVAAMLWPYTDTPTLQELLTRLDRPFMVTDRALRDHQLKPIDLAELTRGVFTVDGGERFEFEPHSPSPPDEPLVLPSGVVLITHSSGTTGVPKLIAFNNGALGAHTELQVRVATALRMRGRVAFCLSYFHNRIPSALATAIRRDGEMLLLDEPTLDSVGELMADFQPTVVETFPNVFVEWERLCHHPGQPFSDVRYFINTFDAIHPRTVERLLHASGRRYPLYIQAYGSTETGPLAVRFYTRWGIRKADVRCVGYPIPGFTRNRLKPRPGTDDAAVRRGEIVVRARGAAVTYVNEPVKKAPGSPMNWWGTGDLGERGHWGCLHLLDRIVDETPGLGSNLAVEDLLMKRLPALNEVVVLPGADGGLPLPVICTEGDRPLAPEAWSAAVADLPALAEPLHVPWQRLPRSSTWKVRRIELRRQLAAGEVQPLTADVVMVPGL